jgi:hypothetical protein
LLSEAQATEYLSRATGDNLKVSNNTFLEEIRTAFGSASYDKTALQDYIDRYL